MLRRLGLHRADDGELVEDARTLRHQFADMHAGDGRGNRTKGPRGFRARLWVPGFKLARRLRRATAGCISCPAAGRLPPLPAPRRARRSFPWRRDLPSATPPGRAGGACHAPGCRSRGKLVQTIEVVTQRAWGSWWRACGPHTPLMVEAKLGGCDHRPGCLPEPLAIDGL